MYYNLLMKKLLIVMSLVLLNFSANASDEKKLFFVYPKNGDIVSNPVEIKFGISGMKIVPAGVNEVNSGHHHLLINLDKLPDLRLPIPSNEKHLHFGKGQTSTTLNLDKGEYSLQLLLGDHNHIPHKPPLISEKIYIQVK